MDRLESLRLRIDSILRVNPDPEDSRCGFVHLYGVSAMCTLMALKRGLDPVLGSAAGMLHDIWNYQVGESTEHARLGAVEAENLLREGGDFSEGEIAIICQSIARHSNKQAIDDDMDELLKDADVLQHYLFNPAQYLAELSGKMSPSNSSGSAHHRRLEKVLAELGVLPGLSELSSADF